MYGMIQLKFYALWVYIKSAFRHPHTFISGTALMYIEWMTIPNRNKINKIKNERGFRSKELTDNFRQKFNPCEALFLKITILKPFSTSTYGV